MGGLIDEASLGIYLDVELGAPLNIEHPPHGLGDDHYEAVQPPCTIGMDIVDMIFRHIYSAIHIAVENRHNVKGDCDA